MEKSTPELKKTADWLKSVADAMNWNHSELAAAIGVGRATLYRWFSGEQQISSLAKRRLLDVFLAHEIELRKKGVEQP
jgi:transcriptional regulator with XRE-family HTH domain